MDDLKEKIYLLALDIIKKGEASFVCDALEKSYVEYTGAEGLLGHEERQEFFSEFFNLYDGRYWYYPVGDFIKFMTKSRIHGCWWQYGLVEPRERILRLILNRGCR